jgi:predicted kinase
MQPQVIVISGSMGSGKTTVLGEASDVLSARGVAHATIDLDALGCAGVPRDSARDLVYRSLEAIYANILNAGIARVLLAEAVEDRDDLSRIHRAMPGATIVVCRLTAAVATMQRRLRTREPGILQHQFLERARELDDVLQRAALEEFTIVNDDRLVTDVARELLQRAGWIDATRG